MISPGEQWDPVIAEHLRTADIIRPLISADFIASDYCWDVVLGDFSSLDVPLGLITEAQQMPDEPPLG
jgi:hypothetical protein